MKNIALHIIVFISALTTITPYSASAQEVVTDYGVYNRVTGYIDYNRSSYEEPQRRGKNIPDIRWRHDIRIGYGAPSLTSEFFLTDTSFGYCDCWKMFKSFSDNIHDKRYPHGPTYKLSNLYFAYSYTIRPWFKFGFKSTFAGLWSERRHALTGEKLYSTTSYTTSALVDMRFEWLRRRNVQLYSSLGVGVAARIERANGVVIPMADVTLIGISVGRGLYGFIEIGEGISGSLRAGVGVRFNNKK